MSDKTNRGTAETIRELLGAGFTNGMHFPQTFFRDRFEKLELYPIVFDGKLPHRGFPHKFIHPFDEANCALEYLLRCLRKEDSSTLVMNAVHVPPEGGERDFPLWQMKKASLLLDHQFHALSLHGSGGRNVVARRLFVFRRRKDIRNLTRKAISALVEQQAIGIEIGFVFTEDLSGTEKKEFGFSDTHLQNLFLVEFRPTERQRSETFILLSCDESERGPYGDGCYARWFSGKLSNEHLAPLNLRFSGLEKLFDSGEWIDTLGQEALRKPLRFEVSSGTPYQDVVTMLDSAFRLLPESGYNKAEKGLFSRRLAEEVYPQEVIDVDRAMGRIQDTTSIIAVDPTSVKKSLRLQAASTKYREWLRAGIMRCIEPEFEGLLRVYIVDDSTEEELGAVQEILRFYTAFVSCGAALDESWEWLRERRRLIKSKLFIFVTTRDVLSERLKQMTDEELGSLKGPLKKIHLGNPIRLQRQKIVQGLERVDFLATKEMFFNFTNRTGDPLAQGYPPNLYRSGHTQDDEWSELFGDTRYLGHVKDARAAALFNFLERQINDYRKAVPQLDSHAKAWEKYKRDNHKKHKAESEAASVDKRVEKGDFFTAEEMASLFSLNKPDVLEACEIKAAVEQELLSALLPGVAVVVRVLLQASLEVSLASGPATLLIEGGKEKFDQLAAGELSRKIVAHMPERDEIDRRTKLVERLLGVNGQKADSSSAKPNGKETKENNRRRRKRLTRSRKPSR